MSGLDEVDAQILRALAVERRLPNNALASRVGIAPSTCVARVRSLRQRGVIRGFAADIDPVALGLPIQATVSVRMQAHARGQLEEFLEFLTALPGVVSSYLLAGPCDFLVHVVMSSVEQLREFVISRLSGNPDVASTETNMIFRCTRPTRVPLLV